MLVGFITEDSLTVKKLLMSPLLKYSKTIHGAGTSAHKHNLLHTVAYSIHVVPHLRQGLETQLFRPLPVDHICVALFNRALWLLPR